MRTGKRLLPIFGRKPFLLVVILFFLALIPLSGPSIGQAAKTPERTRLMPSALLKWPANGSEYAVLVDKSRQKVFLYHKSSLERPKRTFSCSTGEKNGPKSRQNDRKTPEGIYFFTNSFEEKDLTPIYGVRAFPIDYPNPIDRKEGRDGYGIWFHGTNKPLKPNDSNGCIVLDNRGIDELAGHIQLNETPAIISSKIEMINPAEAQREAASLEKVIEEWRRAWEGKDVDRYMSFYSPRFTSGGKDWDSWKDYKSRLAEKYRDIRVEIDDLLLLRNGPTLLATFTQRYSTPGFHSEGIKRLYFQQNSTEWKIIGEVFRGMDKPLPVPAAAAPEPTPIRDIEGFVDRWKKAWEKKDLKAYISCYDSKFRSRGMDLRSWKRHRQKLNAKYRTLEIVFEDLKIEMVSRRTARVTFRQQYRADGYRDMGIKEMFLVKKGMDWKIRKEEWRPVERASRP